MPRRTPHTSTLVGGAAVALRLAGHREEEREVLVVFGREG